MIRSKVSPKQILFRPPVEAYSLLIAVTSGCSWNKCKFCDMYKGKDYEVYQEYEILPLEYVFEQIDRAAKNNYHGFPVYLAGGNPTSAPTDHLVKIIKYVREKLNNVKRVSCYSKALDILRKSDEELKELKDAGLDIVYMGLESGSNTVLRFMHKGTNANSFIKAGKKVMEAGIQLSLYVLLGLGGKKYSKDHVLETARVLTEINPTIFRFRSLGVGSNIPLWYDLEKGEFELIDPVDYLIEERDIIANLGENVTSQVFNDHAANYCYIESNNIKEDRDHFIHTINSYIKDPRFLTMERKIPR
ncbi:MAG: radical SAM protein [Candidatus Lokiarchaeota archaeon]|nr:radical SAM protein [Candidatus Lokiarchaeota archaeon]